MKLAKRGRPEGGVGIEQGRRWYCELTYGGSHIIIERPSKLNPRFGGKPLGNRVKLFWQYQVLFYKSSIEAVPFASPLLMKIEWRRTYIHNAWATGRFHRLVTVLFTHQGHLSIVSTTTS